MGTLSVQAMVGEGSITEDIDDGSYGHIYIEKSSSDHFIENNGQKNNNDISLYSNLEWGHVGLGTDGFYIDVQSTADGGVHGHMVKFEMVDCNIITPTGLDMLSHRTNYIIGNDPAKWVIGARSFKGAVYRDLWQGIDLGFETDGEGMKYEYRLHPGSKADQIGFRILDSTSYEVEDDMITVRLSNGMDIMDGPLRTFYSDGEYEAIDSRFREMEDGMIGIELGSYDSSRPVTIDPILFSTFLGGQGADHPVDLEIDRDGNTIVAGVTQSTGFPTTTGSYKASLTGLQDIFISKVAKNGSSLLFSTFLGGSWNDDVNCIKVDSKGNIHISGYTSSNDYPTKEGAYDRTYNQGSDLVVSCINSTGSDLLRSTYIGASSWERFAFLDLDSDDRPVVLAQAFSNDFPVTNGSYMNESKGQTELVVFKLEKDYSDLNFSTYIGGSLMETPYSLIVDKDDDTIYGTAISTSFNFPTTNGSFSEKLKGWNDAVLFRLSKNGSRLLNSTYFGGNGQDFPYSLLEGTGGDIYIAGSTGSNDLNTTDDAFSSKLAGYYDMFLAGFSSDLSKLKACTYLGGSSNELYCYATQDGDGNLLGILQTASSDMPVVKGSMFKNMAGTTDLSVFRIDSNLSDLDYCTYFGGTNFFQEFPKGIASDASGNVLFIAETDAKDFPITENAYDNSTNGVQDCAVVMMDFKYRPLPPVNVTGEVGNGWVNLSWDEAKQLEDYNILGYEIHYGNSTEDMSLIGWANGTDHYNHTVVTGEDHYFSFRAFVSDFESELSKPLFLRDPIYPGMKLPVIPEVLGTGDNHNFTLEAWDNVLIDQVKIDYSYWLGAEGNDTMSTIDGSTYFYDMTVFQTMSNLTVRFLVEDMYRNWIVSDEFLIDIVDNDLPVILEDMTPASTSTKKQLSFELRAMDNIGIEEVKVKYQLPGDELREGDMEIVTSNHYKHTIGIPNVIGTLDYSYHILDRAGNWLNDTGREVVIEDLIDPVMQTVVHDETATTGEITRIEATTSDNIGVDNVILYYRFGDSNTSEISMGTEDNVLWYYDILVIDTTEELIFSMKASDISLNNISSEEYSIEVLDNDRPFFMEDTTDDTAHVGRSFTISIPVGDNILVEGVFMEYWFNGHGSVNISMSNEGGGLWNKTITTPCELCNLRYVIRAVDSSGNWNITGMRRVVMLDEVGPEIGSMEWVDLPTTGDLCGFKITATDNVELSSVNLGYRFEGTEWTWINTTKERSDSYSATIFILEDAGQVEIRIDAVDSSGNSVSSDILRQDVIDDDKPTCSLGSIPVDVLSDHHVNFTFELFDNKGIELVTLSYWIYKDNTTTLFPNVMDNNVSVSIPIEWGAEQKELKIEVIIEDVSGNIWESGVLKKMIEDGTLPEIDEVGAIVVYQGETFEITLNVTDDRTKVSTAWTFMDEEGIGKDISISAQVPGDHVLFATATDSSDNSFTLEVPVTVLPEDHDQDHDGIPDLKEKEMDLDPLDPNDALLDNDLDGLTNIQEFLNGTDIIEPDTDKDGMDDGWEVMYGLDPRKESSGVDTDGDGRSDLDEYLDGTDPTVKDEDLPVVMIVVISIVAILVIGSILLVVLMKRRNREEDAVEKVDDKDAANPFYSKKAPEGDLKAAPSLDTVLDNNGDTTSGKKTGTLEDGTGYIRPEESKENTEE